MLLLCLLGLVRRAVCEGLVEVGLGKSVGLNHLHCVGASFVSCAVEESKSTTYVIVSFLRQDKDWLTRGADKLNLVLHL